VEFQPTWLTSTVFPFFEITEAFQMEEMAPGIETVALQSLTGVEPVFFKTTAPVRPDPQSESTRGTATSVAKEFIAVRAKAKAVAFRVGIKVFIEGFDWCHVRKLKKFDEPA
jgi:hypothetical protein